MLKNDTNSQRSEEELIMNEHALWLSRSVVIDRVYGLILASMDDGKRICDNIYALDVDKILHALCGMRNEIEEGLAKTIREMTVLEISKAKDSEHPADDDAEDVAEWILSMYKGIGQ